MPRGRGGGRGRGAAAARAVSRRASSRGRSASTKIINTARMGRSAFQRTVSSARAAAKGVAGRSKSMARSTCDRILSAAKKARDSFEMVKKATTSVVEKGSEKAVKALQRSRDAALPFLKKYVAEPVIRCPVRTALKVGKRIEDYRALRHLRIGQTRDGFRTLRGAKKALGWSGAGKFHAVGMAKKLLKKGAGPAALIDGVVNVADEALQQYRDGRWDAGRLAAKAASGAIKGVAEHATFAIAAAGTAGLIAAGVLTAPAWVPAVVGVAASIGVGMLLDKVDKDFQLTDKAAKALNAAGTAIAKAAGNVAETVGSAASNVIKGIGSLMKW